MRARGITALRQAMAHNFSMVAEQQPVSALQNIRIIAAVATSTGIADTAVRAAAAADRHPYGGVLVVEEARTTPYGA